MSKLSKVYPFIIVLKNKQQRAVRLTGILMGLMAIVLFCWNALQPEGSGLQWIGAAVTGLFLAFNVWEMRKGRTTRFSAMLLAAGLGLLAIAPHQLIGLLYILLAFLERQALAGQEIGFSDDEIVLNGVWRRKIQWSELNNVVLRDGLLTIDFKNDRLIQKETDDLEDDDYDGDEDEFNVFCQQQLQRRQHPAK